MRGEKIIEHGQTDGSHVPERRAKEHLESYFLNLNISAKHDFSAAQRNIPLYSG
jgi:hypothetical protein